MTAAYPAETLRSYAGALLQAAGLAPDRAATVAEILVEGDLLGHDTHGLAQLPGYLGALVAGTMAATGDPSTVADRGAAILWDGQLPLLLVAQQMFAQTQSFPMLALPFFILAGALMMDGKLGQQLLMFAGEAMERLRGARVLVVNGLFFEPHPSHLSIPEAIDVARLVGAERTYLTHLTHDNPHAGLAGRLPAGIEPAYDGLVVTV